MGKRKLRIKKYVAGILLIFVLAALVVLLKIGNLDKLKGTIKIKEAYLSNVSTKLNASVYDASSDSPVVSNGFDEVKYVLKYKLSNSNQARDVIITGTLDSDNGYASFKRVTGNNITSTLSDDNKKIEIVINNLPAETEITTNIALTVNGAPDGYVVRPSFKIKESTAENYTDIYTNPIEVSTNSLRGTVRDLQGDGIPNIIISAYKGKKIIKETYTNDKGEYIFSDLPEDNYTIKVNEEIYRETSEKEIIVSGDTKLDLTAERIYPFNLEVHKYITKIDASNSGTSILKTYNNASMVSLPIKQLTNFGGKVYYSIVVENTGEKEGIVSAVKDELPDFMSFDEKLNDGFELKDGYIYDRNLEGKVLQPGEKITDTLVLNIVNTNAARTYLNRVNALGEIYDHVVYILDGNTYREEDVLEGEKTVRPSDPMENFGGWYTDSEYTNLYNFNNPVTKDLILYGKTGQKYTVSFYDKNPENGDEDLYTSKEVDGGNPVDEPNDHPDHTGYNFNYWCTVDFNEYNFNAPVNEDLKLISCYTIKKYDVNFYNYNDTKEKEIKVEYKHLIDQTLAPTFDETGYTFICWTVDKTNCFDFTTPIVKKTDLYPKHEQLTNAVVFNDENRVTTVDNVPYGNTVDPIDNQGKDGHTFRCWSEDRTNCFDFSTPIIETKTVYAIYDINQYTVTFIDRDPETSVDTQYGETQTINWGSTVSRPGTDPSHTGYTFAEWTKDDNTTYDFATPVKSNLTLISKYNINTYPVRFHNDNDVTTVYVEYKNKVSPITSPTKEHYVFKNWLKEDDTAYDFDTLITNELDLYSSFEEVLAPSISHTPTMWTNSSVTVTIDHNSSLTDTTGYSYLYKTSSTDYSTYSDPFAISENTTIIAKGSKENVDSVVTNHTITNIDKLNPSVTLFNADSVNKNSAVLNINALDNESGVNYYEVYQNNVKIGEKHLECYNETEFDAYETCRSNYPDERETTYEVTGLTPSTTYTFKVRVYDKAGNYVDSNSIEVTTTTPIIVARLIGYNNSLFENTVDPVTGDVTVPKEDKYINFESLEEAFDYEDLYDCKHVQCTIQMVRSTNESVQVLAGQDLALDLNGKTVAGVSSDYTIKNNGSFTLLESTPEGETPGQLINNQGIAILNKSDAHVTLGEGYSDRQVSDSVVSTTKPYVYGATVGIKNETDGYFSFFDGKIVAPATQVAGTGAVNGRVTEAEYLYSGVSNSSVEDGVTYQVVTLGKIASPEARINNMVYYAKLNTAMNEANRGITSIDSDDNAVSLMADLKPAGEKYFKYDDVNGVWVSDTGVYDEDTEEGKKFYEYEKNNVPHAKSYLIVDLRNETDKKVLRVDYSIEDGENYINNDYIEKKNVTVNKYNDYVNRVVGDSVSPFAVSGTSYEFELDPGEIYIVNFDHYILAEYRWSKWGSDDEYYGNGRRWGEMTIHNITLGDLNKNTDNINIQEDVSLTAYGFYYDETDRAIKSNTQYQAENSLAYGYTEVDLTDKSSDEYFDIIVNATMESYRLRDGNISETIRSSARVNVADYIEGIWGNSILSFDPSWSYSNLDEYIYDSAAWIEGGYNSYGPSSGSARVSGGKKYYIKYFYKKEIPEGMQFPSQEEFEAAGCRDQLIINSIDVVKVGSETTDIDVKSLKNVENSIMDDMVSNSNGGVVKDGETIRTNFTGLSQTVDTYADIDLTNDPVGKMLAVEVTKLSANGYGTLSMDIDTYYHDRIDCTNCFLIFQDQTTSNGTEHWGDLKIKYYDESVYDPNGYRYYLIYHLPAGHKYRVKLNITSPSYSVSPTPNIVFNRIETYESASFEGNYFDGIGLYDDNYDSSVKDFFETGNTSDEDMAVMSNSLRGTANSYKDSFIKIDLTNYDKDQVLKMGRYGSSDISKGIVYLTNNNRALTESDVLNNKSNLLLYGPTFAYGASSVVLEKGKIYYLHFGDILNTYTRDWRSMYESYGESIAVTGGLSLNSLTLTPIEESIMTVGTPTVFTGTYDVNGEREEGTTIRKRTSSVPNINGSDTVYGFDYDSETGWYTALNEETGSIAIQRIKIDLTGKTKDTAYTLETNYDSDNYSVDDGYYKVGDDEEAVGVDINLFKESTSAVNYDRIKEQKGLVLEKGKVHYIQIVTATRSRNTPFKFKLTEMETSNETTEHNPISEVKEFNEHVDTVQLLRNVNTPNTLTVNSSEEVVLDLNGYSLTSTQDYVIDNAGDLTIMDTKYERTLISYDDDLAEYQEYAGLCDGCEPSDEYKYDHINEYMEYFKLAGGTTEFSYTGKVQKYTVPATGTYKLQVWGAQGGYRSYASNGGKGGYSEGTIELQEGETLYVYVGGSGNTGGTFGGFNGGGSRASYNGGGGATDIRVEGDSLYNRIIVAGGGGSDGAYNKPGKAGGGTEGISATESYGSGGSGGTQTYAGDGGDFGQGGYGSYDSGGYGGAGGGGWYGGGGSTPDGSGDDDRGGGGGSGFVYTNTGSTPVDGYLVQNHVLTEAKTVDGTNENIPTHDGTSTMTGNSGDGYAIITTLPSEEQLNEIRENLPKTYNIKEEPILGAKSIMTNDNGTGIIKNREDSTLSLKNVILDVGSEYGVYNEGTIVTIEDPVVNVKTKKSTGIANVHNGDIVNNGNLKINIEQGDCYANDEREYRGTGISYTNGTHSISNVEITGTNGTGIKVDEDTILNVYSSDINVVESSDYACNWTATIGNDNDGENPTQMYGEDLDNYLSNLAQHHMWGITYPYRNNYNFTTKTARTSSGSYNRNDSAIYNKGTTSISDGSSIVGSVKNFGNATINDGTTFDEIYQMDKFSFLGYENEMTYFTNVETNVYNTVSNINKIVNIAGTVNVIEEDGQNSSLTSSNRVAIYNFGEFNTDGGEMPKVFNMGDFTSNNTDFESFYNINTIKFISGSWDYFPLGEGRRRTSYSVRGIANLTGGTVNDLVNEYNMTLDSINIPNGILNRGDLVVKGNSTITGTDKPAILNAPMIAYMYRYDSSNSIYRDNGVMYGKISLTIGDDDGNLTSGPTITTTNSTYAITGYCDSKGTTGTSDMKYRLLNSDNSAETYSSKEGETYPDLYGKPYDNGKTVESIDYPTSSNNLCKINYYDGTIKNASATDITDVVDIPIENIASGYDVLYSNNSGGTVSLATIDDSSRSDVITVNGTSYKSLETAISEAPDNSIINITGNYDSANKVTIPADKNLTINYLLGATLNSYSKDALITNNGNLTIAGDGTNNIIGEFAYENNNTMTFNGSNNTNNEDFYYKQSNLIKNNSDLIIDNVTSNKLDIVSLGESEENKISLTINDGTFNSNTIHAEKTDILVNKGYFDSTESTHYYETYKDDNMTLQTYRTKPTFNVKDSVVTFNNFNVDTDTRYSNISLEQNLGRFGNSVLNLNNSVYGGKSSKSQILAMSYNGGEVNVADGTYNNLKFNIFGGVNYNQTAGTINGSLLVSDVGNTINITSGKILSSANAGILLYDASGTSITAGTKGDLIEGTENLKVSKTDPEIKGGTYGITSTGTYSSPNVLYFYDGIFKGNGNPIDLYVEDIEVGYDIVYNRNASPEEKYLDTLPLILNYTSGVYYYDVQDAFNAANEDDELIWVRDYTNFADTPSLVVPQGKKFKLYFSYMKAENTPYYLGQATPSGPVQDEFKPYTGTETIPSGYTTSTDLIKINNEDSYDSISGVTTEASFLINNGNLTIIGTQKGLAGGNSIFESLSGSNIITNNGTLYMDSIAAMNVKDQGTMFKNNANSVMTVKKGGFETQQATVFDNYGTFNIVEDSSDTNGCYIPTYIKVDTSDALENAYRNHAIMPNLLGVSIINHTDATMNIAYLYYDSDYTYNAILNDGTLTMYYSLFEQFKDSDPSYTLSLERPIINNGTMTSESLNIYSPRGILNNGNMTLHSGSVKTGYDNGITNTGTLVVDSTTIYGAGKGIEDTGSSTISGYINTYEEAYYGTGNNTTFVDGMAFQSYGKRIRNYNYSNDIYYTCSNNTNLKKTINATLWYENHHGEWKYTQNNAAIYVGNQRTFNFDSGSASINNLSSLEHFCGTYANKNNYAVYECIAPYAHDGENGSNYTIGLLEADHANVTIRSTSLNNPAVDGAYALYLNHSTFTQLNGYVGSSYVANTNEDVTLGVLDGSNSTGGFLFGNASCSTDFKGLNYYDATVQINPDNFCKFNDKEPNYTIYGTGGNYYSLGDVTVITNVTTGESYSSIPTAVSSAGFGDTLQLTKSPIAVNSEYNITVDKDLTLDLNGNTLSANINVTSGTVTVTDEAYIENNNKPRGRLIDATNTGGTLNINSIVVNNINNSSTTNVINASVNDISNTAPLGIIDVTGGSVGNLVNTGVATLTNTAVTNTNNSGLGSLSLINSTITEVQDYDSATITMDSDSRLDKLYNYATLTLSNGTVVVLENLGNLTINGANISNTLYNKDDNNHIGYLVINSGYIKTLDENFGTNLGNDAKTSIINGGTIGSINHIADHNYVRMQINGGTVGSIKNGGYIEVKGGTIGSIINGYGYGSYNDYGYYSYNFYDGYLIIGTKDNDVNTSSPVISNNDGYAVTSNGNSRVYFYDGRLTSNKPIVISATVTEVETGYNIYTAPDYDGGGNLTGTYSMTLIRDEQAEVKIACSEGICYDTLQEAIDASARNYTVDDGCPEVVISSEYYFAIELDADLVLDPQYTMSINLNYHNLNDNGYTIPDNITLRNGSRNGTDLQSSLSKFLANVFDSDKGTKDIIITKMSDGKELDTAKTYNLYKYENGTYSLVKLNSDGAGKYSPGKETVELKSIKGRIYISDLSSGEYMLKDNLNTELEFNIYENGTLSPNIKENITTNYGRMTASAVATLIVSIQTGILRYGYILAGLIVVILIIIILLNIKRKSIKETI